MVRYIGSIACEVEHVEGRACYQHRIQIFPSGAEVWEHAAEAMTVDLLLAIAEAHS